MENTFSKLKLKLNLLNGKDNQEALPKTAINGSKAEWKVGRVDKNKSPDVDLGKDFGCSRDTGTIHIYENSFTFQHEGSCTAGYIIGDKPFQILDNFCIDIGGQLKQVIEFQNVSPASQVKAKPEQVLSPLFIKEGRTEGLQKNGETTAKLQLVRKVKNDEFPIPVNSKPQIDVPKDKDFQYKFSKALLGDSIQYEGEFEISFVAEKGADKAFWQIRVTKEDPNKPVILLFRDYQKLLKNQVSEEFTLYDKTRLLIGTGQYQVELTQ